MTSPSTTEAPATTAPADQAAPEPEPRREPPTVEHRSGPDGFSFDVAAIDDALRVRIEPTSWRPGCPVSLDELRYLRLSHRGFDGVDTSGELIVHRDQVEAMFTVFSALWTARFPIRSMRLIDDFGGDDYRSIEADNTSAFNCRFVEGTSRWSNHATGGAIDINPLENPYVSGGATSHPASVPFLSRHVGTGLILEGGPVVTAFDAVGWDWGGRWGEPLDYQHFSAAGG